MARGKNGVVVNKLPHTIKQAGGDGKKRAKPGVWLVTKLADDGIVPAVTLGGDVARKRALPGRPATLNRRPATVLSSLFAISCGASAGAILRWLLGLSLNALFPAIPMGTLAANLLGGYLIGIAVALLAGHPALAPEWRLLIVTGFLGGLTTFSTFSAEVVSLMQEGRLLWAGAAVAAHVIGSLVMTLFGLATVTFCQRL